SAPGWSQKPRPLLISKGRHPTAVLTVTSNTTLPSDTTQRTSRAHVPPSDQGLPAPVSRRPSPVTSRSGKVGLLLCHSADLQQQGSCTHLGRYQAVPGFGSAFSGPRGLKRLSIARRACSWLEGSRWVYVRSVKPGSEWPR